MSLGSKGYTVIYLTPNSKLVIGFLALMFMFLIYGGYDYINNKGMGNRFTKEDGVVLYTLIENNEITNEELDSIYDGRDTDFREFVENNINNND